MINHLLASAYVKRLIKCDESLSEASIAAAHYRIFSQTQGDAKVGLQRRHRAAIDNYNAQKFWFMKRRQYEV